MSAFSFLLNLLWILFGGLWMAAGWVIAAIFMAITIIGLPWTRAAFNIAAYTLLPFGQKVVVTLDLPLAGQRHRVLHNGLSVPPETDDRQPHQHGYETQMVP
jgi:uncharacterized membrane protein YccF (DUF307 family)